MAMPEKQIPFLVVLQSPGWSSIINVAVIWAWNEQGAELDFTLRMGISEELRRHIHVYDLEDLTATDRPQANWLFFERNDP